jgi:hypothetical protein
VRVGRSLATTAKNGQGFQKKNQRLLIFITWYISWIMIQTSSPTMEGYLIGPTPVRRLALVQVTFGKKEVALLQDRQTHCANTIVVGHPQVGLKREK